MHRLPIAFLLLVMSTVSNAADDIRVMSFNIRYGSARDGENHWDKRKDFVAETIARFDPDLLGTQETLGFQKEFPEFEVARIHLRGSRSRGRWRRRRNDSGLLQNRAIRETG